MAGESQPVPGIVDELVYRGVLEPNTDDGRSKADKVALNCLTPRLAFCGGLAARLGDARAA
jgi:hypothetical protein